MMQSDQMQSDIRARLARELHDGIAQDLVGVGYCLDLLLADPDASLDTRSQLRTLRFTISDLIDKVRKEIYFLRQPSTLTLAQNVQSSAEDICQGLDLKLEIEEVSPLLDSDLSYEVRRIAEEVLRNSAMHSQASSVTVSLHEKEKGIELRIADNGIGGAVASDGRYGIQGIRDRATAINGSVEIRSDADGTCVSLLIPKETNADG